MISQRLRYLVPLVSEFLTAHNMLNGLRPRRNESKIYNIILHVPIPISFTARRRCRRRSVYCILKLHIILSRITYGSTSWFFRSFTYGHIIIVKCRRNITSSRARARAYTQWCSCLARLSQWRRLTQSPALLTREPHQAAIPCCSLVGSGVRNEDVFSLILSRDKSVYILYTLERTHDVLSYL